MPETAIAPTDPSVTARAAGQGHGVLVSGACVTDCIWCGDHNRLLAVTSAGVIGRCLRCGEGAVLKKPPTWCPEVRRRSQPRAVPVEAGSR
jgi:hypothetical protein